MPQKLPINDKNCVEETSRLNEDFIKSYDADSNERLMFLQVMFNILKNYIEFTMSYPSYLKV